MAGRLQVILSVRSTLLGEMQICNVKHLVTIKVTRIKWGEASRIAAIHRRSDPAFRSVSDCLQPTQQRVRSYGEEQRFAAARIQSRRNVMAIFVIFRAVFGYLFLVLMVRIVGRRPGKQLTPFEFVLIFYLGGLTLTGMVGDEASLTNAVTQILTVALCHYVLALLRYRFDSVAQLLDGIPLILLEHDHCRTDTMSHMRLQDDDVMDMAREHQIKDLSGIRAAILESYGEITVVPRKSDKK
jgi:hypothetical protein